MPKRIPLKSKNKKILLFLTSQLMHSAPTELQFRVLRLLESNPPLSQQDLSKCLGVSLGGVNYYLNALIAKGLTEKTALTGAFLKRKMQEYQSLKDEIEALSREVGQLPSTDLGEACVLSIAEPAEVTQASGIRHDASLSIQ